MALNSFNRAALSVFAAVAAAIFVVGAIYAYDNPGPYPVTCGSIDAAVVHSGSAATDLYGSACRSMSA
jgi:hypothetical protein